MITRNSQPVAKTHVYTHAFPDTLTYSSITSLQAPPPLNPRPTILHSALDPHLCVIGGRQ